MNNFLDNTTFSTAYYNIGRGDRNTWSNYTRTTEMYFDYFKNVSNINCNLVIYCEENSLSDLQEITQNRKQTKIIVNSFNRLDFYIKFFEKIRDLMNNPDYKRNVLAYSPTPTVPEYNYPEYNIINFNKISFVKESMNYFDSDYYGWIDFGFGHNKEYVKYTMDSNYSERVTNGDKVFMRSFRIPHISQLFNPMEYLHNNPSIHGSCFLGTQNSINRFYDLIQYSINKSIEIGCIDDDQTQYTMAYLLDPNNFNLANGDWFTHFYE